MRTTPLTPAEAEACEVLSELFLDVYYTQEGYARMAHGLRQLDLSMSDLHKILYFDLFPIPGLSTNCLSSDAEWIAFDGQWLVDEVENRRTRGGCYQWVTAILLWIVLFIPLLIMTVHWWRVMNWLLADDDGLDMEGTDVSSVFSADEYSVMEEEEEEEEEGEEDYPFDPMGGPLIRFS